MQFSTLSAPTLALVLVATLRPADPLTFAPAEKTSIVKTFENETKFDSTAFRLIFDGNEIPSDQIGDVKISIHESGVVHATDEYVKVGKGRPLELVRTYDKLEGKSAQVVTGPGGEEDENGSQKKEKQSKLQGKSVVFKWDAKAEEYKAKFQGDEGDADLLADLEEDLDLLAFLPSDKVDEGASWDLDAKVFRVALSPGGNLKLESPDDDEDDKSRELDQEILENLAGKAQATYKGKREVDGKTLSVIAIKAELKTRGDAESEKRGKMDLELEMDLEGELLWDAKAGHAVTFTLTGTQKAVVKIANEMSEGADAHSMRQEVDMEGTFKLEARFKAQ